MRAAPAPVGVAEAFDLETYLAQNVEQVVKDLLRTAAFHPRESRFMARYALASRKAAARREKAARQGKHVPPFLIASITSICNLHCAGCYARSLETCGDGAPVGQLSAQEWGEVFSQARDMGISFILLAGGEPMVRRDVIETAARFPEILFPVFTNGTMLTGDYLELFDRHRNLLPVLSIEGGRQQTDQRRGAGVYDQVQQAVRAMEARHIAFGASVTVTAANLEEVTSDAFVDQMAAEGCKGIVYVEFVPTSHDLSDLTPDDQGRACLDRRLTELRGGQRSMLLISFPGDEKSAGGCLAAGRGFFHINSHGGAEPCPFSPYSDLNLRDHSLEEALNSPLFQRLRAGDLLTEEHEGGCVLYQKREQVDALLNG